MKVFRVQQSSNGASFPSFGHIGFPTVIEWLPEGVCWRPKTYAVERIGTLRRIIGTTQQ